MPVETFCFPSTQHMSIPPPLHFLLSPQPPTLSHRLLLLLQPASVMMEIIPNTIFHIVQEQQQQQQQRQRQRFREHSVANALLRAFWGAINTNQRWRSMKFKELPSHWRFGVAMEMSDSPRAARARARPGVRVHYTWRIGWVDWICHHGRGFWSLFVFPFSTCVFLISRKEIPK